MPGRKFPSNLSQHAPALRLPRIVTFELSLFLFAYFVHFVVAQVLRGQQGSGLEWAVVANNILAGKGFVFDFYGTNVPRYAFFPPFYPYFLAASRTLSASHWVELVQLIQGVFFALGAIWTRRLAARLMRADLAWIAGYAVALWPPLVIYSTRLTPACFHAAIIPLLLLLLDNAVRMPRLWRTAGAGVAFGLLGYSLPSFLGTLVLLPLGLRRMRLSWSRSFAFTGEILLVAMVVLSPWTIRNALVLRSFVPVATNLGFNLAGSHNQYASSSYNVLCLGGRIQAELINLNELATVNEAAFDRKLLGQGLSYMLHHPLQTGKRDLTRAFFFWWANPDIRLYNFREGLAIMVLMTLLLPFSLFGLGVSLRSPRESLHVLIYCVLVWQTLFYMNFAIRGRYSLELYPLMIVFGVLGAGTITQWLAKRRDATGIESDR